MNTLFDKIWDAHVVQQVPDGPTQLYIDRLYCHEVTSPQAFDGMRARGLKCFRPAQIYCMPDHPGLRWYAGTWAEVLPSCTDLLHAGS